MGSSPISHPADERESGRRVVFERGGDVEIGVVLGGGERHLRIGDARAARKVPRRQAWIFLPVDIDEKSLRTRADSLAAAVAPRPLWETLRAANDAQGEARGWDLSAIVAAWAGARGEIDCGRKRGILRRANRAVADSAAKSGLFSSRRRRLRARDGGRVGGGFALAFGARAPRSRRIRFVARAASGRDSRSDPPRF